MSSTFGQVFRIHTFGESHGGGVGVVIDGCPPRIAVSQAQIQHELDRRRPGQSEIVTPRKEADTAEILSGLQDGVTLGCPIAILVRNTDQRPGAYDEMAAKYRPSHADYTYDAKYGIRSGSGGGRASARETIGRVAAAASRTARDWAELGRETVTWGGRLQSEQQPIPEGPVRDALAAVDAGAKLDANTADWPKLREELAALLKKSEEQKQDQQKQDDKDQQDQKDKQDQSLNLKIN